SESTLTRNLAYRASFLPSEITPKYSLLFLYCCFFFSSRRRHTRSKRDWSSDVCSSDLKVEEMRANVVEAEAEVPRALAEALRSGNMGVMDYMNYKNIDADTDMRDMIGRLSKENQDYDDHQE